MSVYKRGEIYWFRFQYRGREIRGSTGVRDERAAKRIEKLERRRAALDETPTRRAVTLGDAAAGWWELKAHKFSNVSTVANRIEILRSLVDFDRPVSSITTADLAAAVIARSKQPSKHGKPLGPATVNKDIVGVARPILRHASEIMGETVQPIQWAQIRLKEPKERTREFTDAEIRAVLEALPAHWHDLLYLFARYGLRLSEAWFSLRDFDRDTGRIRIRNRKQDDDLTITLLEDDRRALAARAARAEAAGLEIMWFKQTRRGILRPLTPNAFQRAMMAAYKKAGIENARPAHDWRHHAATRLLRSSGNIKLVQRLLGHSSIQSTSRYARVVEDDLTAGLAAAGPLLDAGSRHKTRHTGTGSEPKPAKSKRN